jgi:hypothetical protein
MYYKFNSIESANKFFSQNKVNLKKSKYLGNNEFYIVLQEY